MENTVAQLPAIALLSNDYKGLACRLNCLNFVQFCAYSLSTRIEHAVTYWNHWGAMQHLPMFVPLNQACSYFVHVHWLGYPPCLLKFHRFNHCWLNAFQFYFPKRWSRTHTHARVYLVSKYHARLCNPHEFVKSWAIYTICDVISTGTTPPLAIA